MHDAYAAGLFDGEGMIRVAKHRYQNKSGLGEQWIYQIQATIGVTHRPTVEAVQAAYGGSLQNNRHDLRNPKNRIQFNWVCTSQMAAAFLRRIKPYVIIKKDQLELALEFQAHVDKWRGKIGNCWGQYHPDREKLFAERVELARRITELKKVSFPPLDKSGPGVSESSLAR